MGDNELKFKVIIKNLKMFYKSDIDLQDYCERIGGLMDRVFVQAVPIQKPGAIGKIQNRQRYRNDTLPSALKCFDKVTEYFMDHESEISSVWEDVYSEWNREYKGYTKKFHDNISNVLKDPEFSSDSTGDVKKIFDWIDSISQINAKKEDRCKVLAALTILSYTRHNWQKIAPYIITLADIPDDVNEKKLSDLEVIVNKGKLAWDENKHQEAGQYFRKANQMFMKDESLANDTEKGLILYYLYLLTFEDCREHGSETELVKKRSRDYLLESAGYGYAPAMRELANEYYVDYGSNVVQTDSAKCCEMCHKILDLYPNSQYASDAAWLLYQCTIKNQYKPTEGESAEFFLGIAYKNGHSEAVALWKKNQTVSSRNQNQRIMDDYTNGICYFNDRNDFSDIIIQTRPIGWEYEYDYKVKQSQSFSFNPESGERESHTMDITDGKNYYEAEENSHRIFFFISNDFSKNMRELLSLLQSIKDSGRFVSPEYIKIYIRAYEETVAALIDTALARMEEYVLPLFIIDDDKEAANVLAYHPLFYPIRNISISTQEEIVLHYIIIGNTRGCDWLLKESYWMLTFRNPNIKVDITVLGPDSSEMYDRILYQCPYMEHQKGDTKILPPGETEGTEEALLTIRFINCEYHSMKMLKQIRPLLADDYAYISIDTGNDMDNYSIAIRMREESIRVIDPVKNPQKLSLLPVITYRCIDSDIAYLSERAVVYNQNSGHRWYNDYNIQPYGVLREQYSFKALTDNILEKMGYCIALQYSRIDSTNINNSPEKLKEAQKGYYGKTYNHDSSVCVAKSIGYRLYQCHYPDNVHQGMEHILPPGWDIREKDAFYLKINREYFAKCLYGYGETDIRRECLNSVLIKSVKPENYSGSQLKIDDWPYTRNVDSTSPYQKDKYVRTEASLMGAYMKETYALAEWEQRRWNRYMISRSWVQGSKENAEAFYKQGNKRQQLFIARIHPAITDFSHVQLVNDYLKRKLEKDFTLIENDITSIQMTESILRMDWINGER